MKLRSLGVCCLIGILYIIGIAIFDPRMDDGGLHFAEMYVWEHLLFPITFLGILILWLTGVYFAAKLGIVKFLLALLVWPYGIILAITSYEATST